MAEIVADMSMSLDGFVADAHDSVEHVFAWYGKPQPEGSSAEPDAAGLGVIVYGRRTFDLAQGWQGHHPTGAPVIVVTQSVPDGWPRAGSTVSFATAGIEDGLEKARSIAGDGVIALGSPKIIQQCLNLGVVDRIQVKLVPVLLGQGTRLFENLSQGPVKLENPTVLEGNSVTHLYYRVPGRS